MVVIFYCILYFIRPSRSSTVMFKIRFEFQFFQVPVWIRVQSIADYPQMCKLCRAEIHETLVLEDSATCFFMFGQIKNKKFRGFILRNEWSINDTQLIALPFSWMIYWFGCYLMMAHTVTPLLVYFIAPSTESFWNIQYAMIGRDNSDPIKHFCCWN